MDFLRAFEQAQKYGVTKEEFMRQWESENKNFKRDNQGLDYDGGLQQIRNLLQQMIQEHQQERLELKQEIQYIYNYLYSMTERQEHHWLQIHYTHDNIITELRQQLQMFNQFLASTAGCQPRNGPVFSTLDSHLNQGQTRTTTSNSSQLTNSSSQLTNSSSQITNCASQITNSSSQLTNSSSQLTNSSSQLTNSSSQITNSSSPNQLTNSSSQITNSSSQLTNSASQLTNSASQLTNSSSQLTNSASQLTNSMPAQHLQQVFPQDKKTVNNNLSTGALKVTSANHSSGFTNMTAAPVRISSQETNRQTPGNSGQEQTKESNQNPSSEKKSFSLQMNEQHSQNWHMDKLSKTTIMSDENNTQHEPGKSDKSSRKTKGKKEKHQVNNVHEQFTSETAKFFSTPNDKEQILHHTDLNYMCTDELKEKQKHTDVWNGKPQDKNGPKRKPSLLNESNEKSDEKHATQVNVQKSYAGAVRLDKTLIINSRVNQSTNGDIKNKPLSFFEEPGMPDMPYPEEPGMPDMPYLEEPGMPDMPSFEEPGMPDMPYPEEPGMPGMSEPFEGTGIYAETISKLMNSRSLSHTGSVVSTVSSNGQASRKSTTRRSSIRSETSESSNPEASGGSMGHKQSEVQFMSELGSEFKINNSSMFSVSKKYFLTPFMYTHKKSCKTRVRVAFNEARRLCVFVHVARGVYDDKHKWPLVFSGSGKLLHNGSKKFVQVWQLPPQSCCKPKSDKDEILQTRVCLSSSKQSYSDVTYDLLERSQYTGNNSLTFQWDLTVEDQ